MITQLMESTQNTENKNGQLAKFNPLYEREFVRPAKEHAHKLLRQAKEFNKYVDVDNKLVLSKQTINFSRFNATRDFASFALKAAQAYQSIVNAIDGAWESAKEAQLTANRAKEQVIFY